MNYTFETKEQERVAEARESFSVRLLSDAQFDEAIAITGIVEREILKSGSFKEKLGDYAYAFARNEKFDAGKSETILRDLFKARTGQSMNQMREALAEREDRLTPKQTGPAIDYANAVGAMIQGGDKISFNRAFAHQAQLLAGELGITDAGAKRLMKEGFEKANGRELYDWGKEIEEQFYRPQIEAEKQKTDERPAEQDRSRGRDAARNAERSAGDRTAGRSRSFQRSRTGP